MTHKIPDELLTRFSEFLAEKIGLTFPANRRPDLIRGLAAAARDLGFNATDACLLHLLSFPLTRRQIEILAGHLTVGETYFFREKRSIEVLENHLLPELIRRRRGTGRHLRIWSAGCASGEEAYTIAILLSRVIPDLPRWQIHILATDINTQALKKAARGLYGKWSFRDTPPEIMDRYFVRRERRWEILPQLKNMVAFAYHNLAEDPFPALASRTNAMDLILCRNVLMYFSPQKAQKLILNFHQALAEGGWFIVSLTETSHVRFSPLALVNFAETSVYRKDSRGSPQMAEVGPTCPPAPPLPVLTDRGISPAEVQVFQAPAVAPPIRPSEMPEPVASMAGPGEEAAADAPAEEAARVREMVLKARACADRGDLAAALKWCEHALAADRLNPAWHYLRAAILQEQDALAEAVQSLKKAVYLDQAFVMAHFALGNLALSKGDAKGAKRQFANVLALLEAQQQDDLLPESEGITAGRLKEIVLSTISMRKLGERKRVIT